MPGPEDFLLEIGDVAQLGEHLLCKQGVVGSIPIVSTSWWRFGRCITGDGKVSDEPRGSFRGISSERRCGVMF